jgi:hypothetical protein
MEGSFADEQFLGSGTPFAEVSASLSVSRRARAALLGARRELERSPRVTRDR